MQGHYTIAKLLSMHQLPLMHLGLRIFYEFSLWHSAHRYLFPAPIDLHVALAH